MDGQLKYTRIDVSIESNGDESAWNQIHDEYLKENGLDEQYRKLLLLLKTKAELELDYVLKKDKFLLTLLEIEEENLKIELSNKGEGVSIEQCLIHLGKFVGYYIRAKEISVKEYFVLLNEYKRSNGIK